MSTHSTERHSSSNTQHKQSQHASGSNFKDNPERAREAGKKGGEHSHSGGSRGHASDEE